MPCIILSLHQYKIAKRCMLYYHIWEPICHKWLSFVLPCVWDQYWIPTGPAHYLITLLAHYLVNHTLCLLMLSDNIMVEKSEKVKWSQADDAILLDMLTTTKIRGDWGDNNPKKTVWVECTQALSGSEKKLGGVAKWADTIQGRWQKVCLVNHTIYTYTDKDAQLKQEYDTVKELQGLSVLHSRGMFCLTWAEWLWLWRFARCTWSLCLRYSVRAEGSWA